MPEGGNLDYHAAMHNPHKGALPALAFAALGVVYGDIGTSPLYTLKEVFAGHHPISPTPEHVFGILSLVLWSLVLVVSIKYVAFVMRADNRGEGGIMALIALALSHAKGRPGRERLVIIIGILGAAMFYGDGMVTPAISVLSAVEGLEVATPRLKPLVIPLTITVLFLLFWMQREGTARVGRLFGPVMLLWFSALGIIGVVNIAQNLEVLQALNPWYGVRFLIDNHGIALFALGSVVLAVTGAEALYADMGHFGAKPIQLAWFAFVLPALVLNYFGQGALILREPSAVANPFYHAAPDWALDPLVALATLAAVIASQAVISGAFSVTRQAMQLGFVPRMEVQHTSDTAQGQIYLPGVNWGLFCAVALLVLGFKSSGNLAAAYGIAVTGDMVITSVLAAYVAARVWGWGVWRAALLFSCFLVIELAFFFSNVLKIPDGGWFPLVAGVAIFVLMTTWKRGRALLNERMRGDMMPLDGFIQSLSYGGVARTPGTAIFMTPDAHGVPHPLLHNLKHNKVLHERVVILTVRTLDVPYVAPERRVEVEPLSQQFWRVRVSFGFKDEPDLPLALEYCAAQGLALEMMDTSFFLGRETLIPRLGSDMAFWREKIFVAMFRNASPATAFFNIPSNRVVELGAQVVL